VSTPAQLRIAARIHYSLKHLLGEGIDVAAMLSQREEAQEVLWVCQASGHAELESLAQEYIAATQAALLDKPPALAPELSLGPQDAAWARNTSGFGPTGFGATGFGASGFAPSSAMPLGDAAAAAKAVPAAKRWFSSVTGLAKRTPKDSTH
jgi:hypothetical protein